MKKTILAVATCMFLASAGFAQQDTTMNNKSDKTMQHKHKKKSDSGDTKSKHKKSTSQTDTTAR